MRNAIIFFSCIGLAVIGAIAFLAAILPAGEGAFGIAKLVPFLFVIFALVFFCLIWFPANLIVRLCGSQQQNGKWFREPALILSAVVFALALFFCGSYFSPRWFRTVQFEEKLEDQFGNPVAGAKIRVFKNAETIFNPRTKETALESDANGLFRVTCRPDESFNFIPQKEGYALISLSPGAAYSEQMRMHQKLNPHAITPTIIKMWKLQKPEPLLRLDEHYRFRCTNSPINVDLVAGKIISSGGDLKITINRPEGIISEQHPQNWNIQMEAIDGGFIGTSSRESQATYSAPEVGYNPRGTFSHNNGPGLIEQTFFLKSRNGQIFSKFYMLFGINRTPDELIDLTFSGVANTNSSPNWEATAPQ